MLTCQRTGKKKKKRYQSSKSKTGTKCVELKAGISYPVIFPLLFTGEGRRLCHAETQSHYVVPAGLHLYSISDGFTMGVRHCVQLLQPVTVYYTSFVTI